jgi:biotin carboxyl carrier protein
VNGNTYEVSVEESNGLRQPVAPVAYAPVQAAAPAPVAAPAPIKEAAPAPAPVKAPAAGSVGSVKVNSPMPGKIIAVKANVGEPIKRGQVILILEAMKMENEIVAPQEGVLASVNVTAGQNVEAGTLLATLN